MKKILLIAALVSAVSFSTMSVKAQAVEQGTMIVDAFYGFPDLYGSVLEAATASGVTGTEIGSLGPLGGKFEYLVSDKVGIGLIIGYASNSVTWQDPISSYDYKVSLPRIRGMVAFNLHFGSSDSFDPYWMLGAGYASSSFNIETTDPSYSEASISLNVLPVALRTALGGRYFFTDNLGANLEIGFGSGALIQAGISAKF